MKEWIHKISVTLMLAVGELLLGLLLIISPAGLASFVIIALGILLMLLGGFHLYQYLRLSREEAARTWKLSAGAGIVTIGLAFIANQHWMVQVIGALTTLYGATVLATAFMKLQIAVDAFRSRRPYWYLMVISFVLTAIFAMLLFLNPFPESLVWIISGVALLVLAALDGAYFILGRRK